MYYSRQLACLLIAVAVGAFAPAAHGAVFNGSLYYTDFGGGVNLHSTNFSYDDSTHTLSLVNHDIGSLPGADGIVFAPDGDLLVGAAGAFDFGAFSYYGVEKIDLTGTAGSETINTVDYGHTAEPSYHLAVSPSGTTVYTSTFSGRLSVVPIASIGTPGTAPIYSVGGDNTGVTQLAFAPNGLVFYDTSNPNGYGDLGLIDISDLSMITTDRLVTGGQSVHGMVYDSYTKLITTFGAGAVGTIDPYAGGATDIAASFAQALYGAGDYDQGSVDGLGHAFIAGAGALTFVDYRLSGDILHPDYFVVVGGYGDIDDVAPLSGLGSGPSSVPEPASMAIWGLGALGMAVAHRRRKRSA